MKLLLKSALLAGALALAGPAHAVTHILNLNGTVGSGSTATVISGPTQFDFFIIALSGFSPLTLAVGDEVQATITLDTDLTVPSAPLGNFVRFFLIDGTLSGTSSSTTGTMEFFDDGLSVLLGPGGASTANAVVNSFFNGGSSFTFDTVQSNFTIDSLGAPTLDVDTASLDYVLLSEAPGGVPEPGAWAMMLAGFGLIGAALRRRKSRIAIA